MSYILDALRKADAQRERDPARGIHAQPLRGTIAAGPQRGGLRAAFWIATAAGATAIAATAWYLYRDRQYVPVPVSQPAMAQVTKTQYTIPPPAAPAVPAPTASAPAMAAPPAMPAASAVLPPPVVVAPSSGSPPPANNAPSRAERFVGRGTPQPMPPVPGVQPAPPPAAASAIPAAPPTPPVAGLPPDAPKLVITGGVYSSSKPQRMLIVNGQVFSEGADLGSGVSLEEIKPKSAVLRFRGARYSVNY